MNEQRSGCLRPEAASVKSPERITPQAHPGSRSPLRHSQTTRPALTQVAVAGFSGYRGSGLVHPLWDPAFPCCSPLRGWPSGPVAASRQTEPVAVTMRRPAECGRALRGRAAQFVSPVGAALCAIPLWKACIAPAYPPPLYGVRLPPPPGFGPGIPIPFPPDELAGCAQTGADKASAASTATPFKRCFGSTRRFRCRTVPQRCFR